MRLHRSLFVGRAQCDSGQVFGGAQGRDHLGIGALFLNSLQVFLAGMKADALLRDGGNHLVVRHLVILHVVEIVATDRPLIDRNVLGRFRIRNEVRQHLVLHLDGADCILGSGFIYGRDSHYFVARPENLRSGRLQYSNCTNPGHLLGSATVDTGDTRVGVRAAKNLPCQQAIGVVVVGIFRAAGNFHGAVDPRDALTQ